MDRACSLSLILIPQESVLYKIVINFHLLNIKVLISEIDTTYYVQKEVG